MNGTQMEAKGLIAGLFDFGFTSFITLKFLRVIYTCLVVLICLGGAVLLLAGLSRGGFGALLGLVVVPLLTLLYLVFARVWMETIALFFRIGENTTAMAAAMSRQTPPPPPPPYAQTPSPSPSPAPFAQTPPPSPAPFAQTPPETPPPPAAYGMPAQ